MTSSNLQRPLILLFLLGAATGLVAVAVALATGNAAPRALGIGFAYLCGIFLGGWLTMGAVSALSRLATFILDRQQAHIDRVLGDTERAFDRVEALIKAGGRDRISHRSWRRRTPWQPPAFLKAISRGIWKISPYAVSIGILWTACGLIILALHRIGGLGNPLPLYALPVGGGLLLALALGSYLFGYLRLWRMLRRGKAMLAELLSIERELTAHRN